MADGAVLEEGLRGARIDFREVPLADLVPLRDGSDPGRVADELAVASEEVGMLYVTGQGVPQRATRHRVINLSGRARYSRSYFVNPNYDTRVEALPSCLAPGETPRHAPVLAGEWLARRLTATFDYRQPQLQSQPGA